MITRLTDDDYARAEQMLAPHRARHVPGTNLAPQWLEDGSRFWYRVGSRYVLVDPTAGTRREAFDHDRLAEALATATGYPLDADNLPITTIEFPNDRSDEPVRFGTLGSLWDWSDSAGTCTRVEQTAPGPLEIPSPDGKWIAFGRDGNIWVRPADGSTEGTADGRGDGSAHGSSDGGGEFALTDDAEPDHEYGTLPDPMSLRILMRSVGLGVPIHATWSPDSTRLLVHRLDQRGLPEQVLVESSPQDGGRPVEHRFRYTMPGEQAQATMSWAVLDVAERQIVRQQEDPITIVHPTAIVYAWWTGKNGDAVHFLQQSRDARTLRLRHLDPETGELRTLITETGTTRVDPTPQLGETPMAYVLDSGEILWWSQRDGWGHLYRYSADGGDVEQVTRGPWQVRRVLRVDQDRRQVWFLAAGLVERDPYVRQICRINLDGTGFTRLTNDECDHDAVGPPGGGYLMDRASTPAEPPRSSVLDEDGQMLVELERPSTSGLEAYGWSPPERFQAVAADGETPIYGLLWRPYGFDPENRYPVIDHIYPGPQVHRAGPSFDVPHQGEPEALAALGFAVVAVDGRGTAGRDKAFHDHSYGDLGNAGALDDHVAAIRQLGDRYPWLDTEKVGITGHSAGGFAAARALLAHPEFYSVGVAIAGNHDNRINLAMWAEHYHGDGDLEEVSNPALAANLRGRLLLVHGELDHNALPYQTLRLVDGLIRADKDVDMLIVPGSEHALLERLHYVFGRTWDYFVRHLHRSDPPGYRLAPLPPPVTMG